MRLQWLDNNKAIIRVQLDAGEQLGNFFGPTGMSVPAITGNVEYDAIIASGDEILPPPPGLSVDNELPPEPPPAVFGPTPGKRRKS
jgi:hypothetical protein